MKKSMIKKSPSKDDKDKKSPKKEIKTDSDIIYPVPSKPLEFTFKHLKNLESLILTEARSGERRSIEEIEKDEKKNQEKQNKVERNTENSVEDEEIIEKKIKKKVEEVSDIVEMRIFDKSSEVVKGKSSNTKKNKALEQKTESQKKKVIYVSYTNAIILHDNEIHDLSNIDVIFNKILIEPSFLVNSGRERIELIQWLDLSHNHIRDIHKDIQKLVFLKILYLHANYITEIDHVKTLVGCNCLINVTLHGNSIEHIKGYRHFIIEMLPKLEKLDFTLVSEKELDVIHFKGSRNGEIRDKITGKVLVYPKLDDRFIRKLKEDKSNNKSSD